MNSLLMSDGKKCLYPCSWILILAAIVGCQTPSTTRVQNQENPVLLAKELDDEVSLKSDREQLNELRKDIPVPKQVSNDEVAMDLELMSQAEKPPHEIRSRFQQKVQKLRQTFRNKSQKIRDRFRNIQKKQRDQFLKELKEEREDFRKRVAEREKTKEFFAKQDLERKDFFALQKDQRQEFESEMRQKSKDFHANMRERERQFNEQLRQYSKIRSEKLKEEQRKKKLEKSQKSSSGTRFKSDPKLDDEAQKILKEFDEMKSMPSDATLGN